MLFISFLTILTSCAFSSGVALKQTTVLHFSKISLMKWFLRVLFSMFMSSAKEREKIRKRFC